MNNDELKDAITAMYRVALEGCTTRKQCMDLCVEIASLASRLEGIASDECFDRANELEPEEHP